MEIRSAIPDDPNASIHRIDITRRNREAIESHQPLQPKVEENSRPQDPTADAKAIREARDEYREQRQERIANAREHYTEFHAAQVAAARADYAAKLQQRYENTHPSPPSDSADRVDLSRASQHLAALDSTAGDEQRTSRLAELRDLFQRGELLTDDLVARTAYRLLGGE